MFRVAVLQDSWLLQLQKRCTNKDTNIIPRFFQEIQHVWWFTPATPVGWCFVVLRVRIILWAKTKTEYEFLYEFGDLDNNRDTVLSRGRSSNVLRVHGSW